MTILRTTMGQLSHALAALLLIVVIGPATKVEAQTSGGNRGFDELSTAQARESAERELELARAAVGQARNATTAAKKALEAAVSQHSAEQKAADARSSSEGNSRGAENAAANSAVTKAATDDIGILKKLIQSLKVERAELLTHLTPAHPLIEDADLRLADYEQQLAALTQGKSGALAPSHGGTVAAVKAPASADATSSSDQGTAEQLAAAAERRHEAASRLDEALAKWEVAMRSLESAINAESTAAERLATISSLPPVTETIEPPATAVTSTTQERADVAPPAAAREVPPSEPVKHKGSQALVLAALIIALVVAALASVKLARATDESVFAGADDAAAALALPVVGVIPALSPAYAHRLSQRVRALSFVGQMLLTAAVFAAVAYCVQNPAFLWQLFTDPLEALGGSGW